MWEDKYSQALYYRRKAAGLCVDCGQELDRDGARCQRCRDRINAATKKQREEVATRGVCPRCGKRKLWGDEKECIECRAEAAGRQAEWREKNSEAFRESHAIWSKKTYSKRREAGICTRCGKRPAAPGKAMCGICSARQNTRRRERARQNGVMSPEERKAYKEERGICFFCDNPVKPEYKVCEKHYNANVENQKKANRDEIRRSLKVHFARNKNGKEIDAGENRKNPPA